MTPTQVAVPEILAVLSGSGPEAKQDSELTTQIKANLERYKLICSQIDVGDEAGYQNAAQILANCRNQLDVIEKHYEPRIAEVRKPWDTMCKDRKVFRDGYGKCVQILDGKLKKFLAAVNQEKARMQAALDSQQDQTRQQMDVEIRQARDEGRIKDAKALEAKKSGVVDIVLPSAVPESAALGVAPRWVVEVTDIMELIRSIAEGKTPLMHEHEWGGETTEKPLLIFNDALGNYLANRQRSDLKIPGIVAKKEDVFRRKK